MTTRLRKIRLQQRLTLRELAERLGTTPQTVQRLETDRMTVSVMWLHRFAKVFGISASHLIDDGGNSNIEFLGAVGADGIVKLEKRKPSAIPLLPPVALTYPVAAHVTTSIGNFAQGMFLIGDRVITEDIDPEIPLPFEAFACAAAANDKIIKFGRCTNGPCDTNLFVSHGETCDTHEVSDLVWVAPIKLSIREF